jgi:hypothetical protein
MEYLLGRILSPEVVQLLPCGNFEVHQLGAFGVVDTGDLEVCAFQGRIDVFDVEEEKSGLRGVESRRFWRRIVKSQFRLVEETVEST